VRIPGLDASTDDERMRAVAAGLPVPADAPCWSSRDASGLALAFVVLLPGVGEHRVRAVAAGDPADPLVAEAVVSAREDVLRAIAADR